MVDLVPVLVSHAFNNDREGINEEDMNMVFILDKDKGLKAALTSQFPSAYHGMCVSHLSENVRLKFGAKAANREASLPFTSPAFASR